MPEEWYDLGTELCVRVKEDQDRDFIARLKADSEKLYRVAMCLSRMCVLLPISVGNFQQSHTNAWNSYPFRNGFLVVEYILGIARYFLVPYSATTW